MKFLSNISYNNIDKGIEFLQKNKLEYNLYKDEKTIFHVYWYGTLTRKQLLCINSYLKTQNLNKTKLWIWIDYKTYTEENINIIPKHKNIEIKKYTPDIEAKGTIFENKKFINNENYIKFRSDCARLLFLYNYGGLYYDLDMILLKDFAPLLNIEYCYTWSDKNRGNNGILRLKKQSDNCKHIMSKYNEDIRKNIATNKIIFTNDLNIYCLPSVLFDPVWILHDKKSKSKYSKLNNFDNFFKATDEDISNFFDNKIYAYHWHSRNNFKIEKNSYFEKFELKFKL